MQRIAWQTAEGTALNASGEVRFRTAPGDRGTEVVFDATFSPPGGELGKKIAGIFAEALGTKIGSDLRRFKQLVELGEIVHSDDSVIPGPNPAQPPATSRLGWRNPRRAPRNPGIDHASRPRHRARAPTPSGDDR